jgi:hypothetical protein
MQDKLKDRSILPRSQKIARQERVEVEGFIRYALQAQSASRAVQEANSAR